MGENSRAKQVAPETCSRAMPSHTGRLNGKVGGLQMQMMIKIQRKQAVFVSLSIVGLLMASVGVRGQGAPQGTGQGTAQGTRQGPIYTVGSSARLVLEDVLVTDRSGAAVKGLPATAFHLSDNAVPQDLQSFEEATGETAKMPVMQKGVVSNAAMLQPGGRVVVLLIDPASMEIPDQMYLRLEMTRYVRTMPAGIEAAVFRTYGGGRPLLVQSLTTDHALLQKAIDASVPTITLPQSTKFSNALVEIANISAYLAQVPGRKELIWFSGKFPLLVSPQSHTPDVNYAQAEASIKFVFRLLEKARVEVFPIDCRGITMGGPPLNQAGNEQAMHEDPSVKGTSTVGEGAQDAAGYDAMDDMAAATGGRAFYSTNGLTQAMGKAIDLAGASYTLTYRPTPYRTDGAWHKVKLMVDGPYRVSYRQGYYADEKPGSPDRQRHSSEEEKSLEAVDSAQRERPILFDARLTQQGAGTKGATKLQVEYGIAAKDLEFAAIDDGRQQANVKVAALAYGWDGGVVASAIDTMQTRFDARQMGIAARVGVPVRQTIEVDKHAQYILLSVFDLKTGRSGTVQLTVDSARTAGK